MLASKYDVVTLLRMSSGTYMNTGVGRQWAITNTRLRHTHRLWHKLVSMLSKRILGIGYGPTINMLMGAGDKAVSVIDTNYIDTH